MTKQQRKAWQPMERGFVNPSYMLAVYGEDNILSRSEKSWTIAAGRYDSKTATVEVWGNDIYEATVEKYESGWAYITLKRRDRRVVRDWRHLQSIKNEIVGPEREAFELFPAESRLVDASNQYHLWVVPEGDVLDVGQQDRAVLDSSETNAGRVAGEHKGRQRPFQPGLSTGPQRNVKE